MPGTPVPGATLTAASPAAGASPPRKAAATTATVNDVAFDALKALRWMPAVRTVPPYHDEPVYIEALAEGIITGHNNMPEFAFDPDDVTAIIAYLDTLKTP